MSIMSRISSFETCFRIRLAWAYPKDQFQQHKGGEGCITETDLSIVSAGCICNSHAANRFDNHIVRIQRR
jgi:hypothetical protein